MSQLESLADAPGTLREYETIYIMRPNTTNEGVAEVNTRVRGVIEGMGGKILKVDNWGKRRLAYEVAKERKGIYLHWQYLANNKVVAEFERNMRLLDSVIRYQSVRLDQDVDPNARPSEADDEAFERAAVTAADEEDRYMTRGSGFRDEDDDDDDDDFVIGGNLQSRSSESDDDKVTDTDTDADAGTAVDASSEGDEE